MQEHPKPQKRSLITSEDIFTTPFSDIALQNQIQASQVDGTIIQTDEKPLSKHSSVQTVFAITNSMIGSVCLVLPIVFQRCGILTSTIVMVFLGLVQFKTCVLLVKHQTPTEKDLQEQITRILGVKWSNFYKLASGTFLFIVGIVYFLLVNKTCYSVLIFIFIRSGFTEYAPISSDPTYDQFSIQYQAMILFLPLSLMLLYKDISSIIHLAVFGIAALIAYAMFIIYFFITNINLINLFTWNFIEPAGQFCLAFQVHLTVGQMMNRNINQENNTRDLGLSYIFSGLIYGAIGVFGAIGITGLQANNPVTILEYFNPSDIAVFLIELLFLVHLFTAFPIFNFVSRYLILSVFYKDAKAPKTVFYGFSTFYIVVCLLFQLANINPMYVIAFDGAVCGFMIVYIIPVALHFRCYYPNKNTEVEDINEQMIQVNKLTCNDHDDIESYQKTTRYVLYFLICSVGFINLVLQMYDLFHF